MKTSSVLSGFRRRSSFAATALLTTLLVPILTSPVAMAFGGGNGSPFSNGSFFPADGTFQATIRGTNLSGVAVFSTSSEGSGGGMFTVFANGNTYIGNTNASISGDTIAASFEASLPGSGTGTSASTISSVLGQTGGTFASGGTNTVGAHTNSTGAQTNSVGSSGDFLRIDLASGPIGSGIGPAVLLLTTTGGVAIANTIAGPVVTPVVIAPALPGLGALTETTTGATSTVTGAQDTITPDVSTKTFGLINTVANSTYNDVFYASGAFTAKLSNSYPNQQFKGSGTMTFQTVDTSGAIPQLVSNTVAISVKGVRTSNTAGTYTPVTVEVPSVFTTYAVTVI
ncbi:MAG: hypothetical protein WCQ16_08730 [Verrucomicrobiae bacterium]